MEPQYKEPLFIFFSVCELAVFPESSNLIGSWSGQNFPVSDHGHGNRVKTTDWKLKTTYLGWSGEFFICGLEMGIFCQLTILTWVVSGKSNKEGN